MFGVPCRSGGSGGGRGVAEAWEEADDMMVADKVRWPGILKGC